MREEIWQATVEKGEGTGGGKGGGGRVIGVEGGGRGKGNM